MIRKAEADLQPVQIAHKVYAMIFRYKADLTTHNAWLRHPRRKRAPQEVQLVVKAYGRAVVVVERWEAEHDFEIVSATHQELEQLREAGYNVALAAHFREIEA